MKNSRTQIIVLVICVFMMTGTLAVAQSAPPSPAPAAPSAAPPPEQMKGKMAPEGTKGEMGGMMGPMMGRMMEQESSEMQSPGPADRHHQGAAMEFGPLVTPLHEWIGCLMARSAALNLTPDQMNMLDDLITQHLETAIRGRAEILASQMEAEHLLRREPVDMPTLKALLKKMSEQELNLQIEGFKTYQGVLDLLTPVQKWKAQDLVGSPFPPPWKKLSSRPCPTSAGETAPSSQPSGKAEMEEKPSQGEQGHESHH
jgi:Spy/CpxP family protein refolding chaperone